MNSHHPDAAAADLPGRDLPKKSAGRGNRRAPWPVVQVVGRSRGVAAAVVTVGMIATGCGSADGGEGTPTTTSAPAAEESGNPWDLPVEQRPALFDPCAEIPVEAIEVGVGGSLKVQEVLTRHEPGRLMACGWANDEIHFTSAASWKSRADYRNDRGLVLKSGTVTTPSGGLAMTVPGDTSDGTCMFVFFSKRGSYWVKLDLISGLSEFRGQRFSRACDVLDEVMAPLSEYFPEGEF